VKFISPPDRVYKEADQVTRARNIVTLVDRTSMLVDRTSMLCPTREDLKVFLAKGLFSRDLSVSEIGVVNSANVRSLKDLVDVATMLRDNRIKSDVRGNERCYKCNRVGHRAHECRSGKEDQQIKCYVCKRPGHRSYDCPDRKQTGNRKPSDQARDAGVKSSKPLKAVG